MKNVKCSFGDSAEICLRIFSVDPRDSDEWNSSFHFKTVPVFRKAPDIVTRLQAITEHFNEKVTSTAYLFTIKPTRCTNFPNLLRHETLHVSGSS